MGQTNTNIWVKPVDSPWECLGVGTGRGIWAEDVELHSTPHGSGPGGFTLKREPRFTYPDILAATPVIVEEDGIRIWKGRVSDTPTRLGGGQDGIHVSLEGNVTHFEDQLMFGGYIHTDLSDFQDMRSVPTASLGKAALCAGGVVTNDQGQLVLQFPRDTQTGSGTGTAAGSGSTVGVVLDLGPYLTAKRAVLDCVSSFTDGAYHIHVRGSDNPDNVNGWLSGRYDDAIYITTSTTRDVYAGDFTTPRRYVQILFYDSYGQLLTEDLSVRINALQIYTATNYENVSKNGGSNYGSALTMKEVYLDALARGTRLFSSDQSLIENVADFKIPDLFSSEPRTAKEVIEAANAYENLDWGVDVFDRPYLTDLSGYPVVVASSGSSIEFEDTSSGSLNDIDSEVYVTGSAPDGTSVAVRRSQSQQSGVTLSPISTPSLSNPTFATTNTGYTLVNSTLTRDTSVVDADVASGRWDATGASDALPSGANITSSFTGTFYAGTTYVLSVRGRVSSGNGAYGPVIIFGDPAGTGTRGFSTGGWAATFSTFNVSWTPATNCTTATFYMVWPYSNQGFVYFDSITLSTAKPTIVERQGFVKSHELKASFMLTTNSANRLGDIYLAAHKTTPFAGKLTARGASGLSDPNTGLPVAPGKLLLMAGGTLHFSDRTNPDSGAWGRDGRMVDVGYWPERKEAAVSIDNRRDDFTALLERVGVQVNQVTR